MKLINLSIEPHGEIRPGSAKAILGLTEYQVQFSYAGGTVDIRLRGNVANQVQRAIDVIPVHEEARRVTTALAILADIGFELTQ